MTTYGITSFTPTISAPVLTSTSQLPKTTTTTSGSGGNLLGTAASIANIANDPLAALSAIPVYGQFVGLLGGIVGVDAINKTLGQIKDGLDCWGSTWTPTRARNELPTWLDAMHNHLAKSMQGIKVGQLESVINKAMVDMLYVNITGGKQGGTDATFIEWLAWLHDSAKDCTKRGLQKLEDGYYKWADNEMKPQLIASLDTLGFTATARKVSKTYKRKAHNSGKQFTFYVWQFTIKAKPVPVQPVETVTDKATAAPTSKPKEAGIGILGILLLIGIAFGAKKFK